jgi:phosphatidylglycerol:prolipoprotein diacylglycerol transferase
VAVPLSLGLGRLACFLGGCCYGTPSDHAWAVHMAEASRHPVQLYEAVLNLALAAVVYSARRIPLPPGDLFKFSLVGYALIRVVLDPWRGDARLWLGPLSLVQITCLVAIAVLSAALLHSRRSLVTHG